MMIEHTNYRGEILDNERLKDKSELFDFLYYYVFELATNEQLKEAYDKFVQHNS